MDPETRCSKKSSDMSNVTNLRSRNPLVMVLEPSELYLMYLDDFFGFSLNFIEFFGYFCDFI